MNPQFSKCPNVQELKESPILVIITPTKAQFLLLNPAQVKF